MPRQPGGKPPPRAHQGRRAQPPRAILNALMWLAAVVLERRIRRAFRAGRAQNGTAGG